MKPIRACLCVVWLAGCPAPPAGESEGAPSPVESPERRPEPEPATELAPLGDIVATVDGQPIPRREFDIRYEPGAAKTLARRTDGKLPAPYQAMQRETILDKLIWSKLLELEAERSGLDFTPEQLAEFEAAERQHIRDWPVWLERVGQTVEVRHQANVDYLRERVLLESRVGPLAPSEDELRAAYEQARAQLVATEEVVRASHLQLAYGPRVGDEKIQPMLPDEWAAATPEQQAEWDAAAKARAVELRKQALVPGVDFNELARDLSEGPGAYRGEDMGLFPRKQMLPAYSDAVFALEPGEISQPVRSDKGYFVIKSFGRYPAGPLPFEAVRADLVRQLEEQKYKQAHAALRVELEGRFAVESAALDNARAFRAQRKRGKGG